MENKKSEIQIYKEEIQQLVSNKTILNNLLQITFKGLTEQNALTAMLEGRMTGFTLQNFLQKDIYALPFYNSKEQKQEYSLVSSIDFCRKIGQKNGVVGTSAPVYTEDSNGNILTCLVVVKKKTGEYIGDYEGLVYFEEYNTKKNLWTSKPRTMIAKVAEMQALRKACPEEIGKLYIEEEYHQKEELIIEQEEKKEEKKIEWKSEMEKCKNIEELQNVWTNMPAALKSEKVVIDFKDEMKIKLTKDLTEQVIEGELEINT